MIDRLKVIEMLGGYAAVHAHIREKAKPYAFKLGKDVDEYLQTPIGFGLLGSGETLLDAYVGFYLDGVVESLEDRVLKLVESSGMKEEEAMELLLNNG